MSRRNKWGLLLVVAVVLVAVGVSVFMGIANYRKYHKPINLGLDLQGGIHIVLEVMPPPTGEELTDQVLDDVKEAIARRVDELGVAEPFVERLKGQNSRRIVVELPGITNIEDARKVIGTQGVLQFKIGDKVVMSGSDKLRTASAGLGGQYGNSPALKMEFSKEGGRMMRDISRNHIGEPMAIYLDEAQIFEATIRDELGESVEVTGPGVTFDVAKNWAAILRGGTLPAPIEERESRSVTPTLGERIVRLSMVAGVIGVSLVLLFMLLVYGLPGLIADIALIVYGLIVYSAFQGIGATLTLPGIAAFLLSVGMAVDANVLIFERIKDERKAGKRLRAAIDAGFHRALTAILDANITTLIVAAILFYLGTSRVQGFAITLTIGVLASMFTAITVTRILLSVVVDSNPEKYARLFAPKGVEQSV